MLPTEEDRGLLAARAGDEEIGQYIHDPSPRVIRALLGNEHLTEDDILILLKRKNLPPDIFEAIGRDRRWTQSYPIRLALVKNPRAPLSISLSKARYLRLFDLAEITRNRFIPLVFRHKIELIIMEQIPGMALGNKKTLAKIARGSVLLKLLEDQDHEVIALCLNNPYLVEAQLNKFVNRKDAASDTMRMIAAHPNWSNRAGIRFALARNPQTPLQLSVPFLRSMKIMDLQELFGDPLLPVSIKPFVYREILARGNNPEHGPEKTIFISEEDERKALDEEALREFEKREDEVKSDKEENQ